MSDTSIRERLTALSAECEGLCTKTGFVGPKTGKPNYRLIYTSVDTYENGNRFVIVGENPGGDQADADYDDRDRPFREKGYSAYLDESWRGAGRGQSPFQRAVQGVAMVVTGASPSTAMRAIGREGLEPEDRIGPEAASLLRSAPSLNIIPFRHSDLDQVEDCLKERGVQIGWELLCLMRPRPRYVITLANQIDGPIWSTILDRSGQRKRSDHEEWINRGLKRKYREVTLTRGSLRGAVLLGLPAVVHDKVRDDVTPRLMRILRRRLQHHGGLST